MQDDGSASSRSELKRRWPLVLASATGVGLGISGQPLYSASLYVAPLAHEFGWSRGAISTAVVFSLFGTIVTSPLIGRLIDRVGPRRVALTSLPLLALGFIALAFNPGSLPLLYGVWLAMSFLGCGTTAVVWTRAINGAFDRQRGIALGLTLAGTGVAAILCSFLLSRVIISYGWRMGYVTQGCAILLVGIPIVWFCFHQKDSAVAIDKAKGEAVGMTARQAAGTPHFWRLLIGILIIALTVAGLIVHLVPWMMDRGMTAASAAATSSMMGFAIVVGRLSVGALLDRISAALVTFVFLLLPAVACILLLLQAPPIAMTILVGLSAGAEVDLLSYLAGRRFGLRHYAEIYGWLLAAFQLGGSVGPMLAGWVHDSTGSYQNALVAGIVLSVAAALLISGVGRRTFGQPVPARALAEV